MAKKKKRGLNLVVLLLALVILVVAYVAYDIYEKKQSEEDVAATEEDDTINVLTVEEDDITSIYYKNETTELTLIQNSEGAWVNQDNQEVPLNSTYTNKMASTIESVTASKQVTDNAEDLSEFGLDVPTLTVTVTKADGSSETVLVGSKSPLGDGYYACLDGSTTVYLLATTFYSAYNYSAVELTEVATAPTITAANITHLLLNNSETGTLEISYDESNEYDTSDSNLAPYVLNQGYDIPVSGDSTNITTYLGNFTSLSYEQCIDYSPEDLSQYGLDTPSTTVSIDYYEDVEVESDTTDSEDTSDDSSSDETETVRNYYTYNLQIGSLDEENAVYYVKTTDSESVYTMAQDTVDAMLTYNCFDLANKYAQLINIKSITEVDFMYNGETHVLAVDHTTTTNDDGEEEDVDVFYLDGTEFDEDTSRSVYQTILSPMFDAEIPAGYTDADQPVVASFTFKRTTDSGKADVITEYRDYDDSFYTVTVNGTEMFLVDKRDVEDAINDFESALNGTFEE